MEGMPSGGALDGARFVSYTYRSVCMRNGSASPPDDHGHPPGAREKLLGAAIDLFTARGYAATSVREIVEHAGLTKPALYYHFGSKEAIYLEILREVRLVMDEALSRLSSGGGPARERLIRFAVGLFEVFEGNVSAARFMNAVLWGPPQGAPPFDFRTVHDAIRAAVGGRLNDATLDKVVRNAASSWTQSGHLDGRSRKRRLTATPTPGAVAFALLLGYLLGVRGQGLFETLFARLLDREANDLSFMAMDAKRLGLLDIKSGGGMLVVSFDGILTDKEKRLTHGAH